jgi:hypothetical protein
MSYPWPYRRIATEEAFCVPEVYMDANGVDVQVLSLAVTELKLNGVADAGRVRQA